MTNIALRVALVALAACMLAVLALGFRAVVLEDKADAVIDRARDGGVSAEDVRQAQDWLDEAGKLNPDRSPDMKEVRLLHVVGRDNETVETIRRVIADEPDNLEAWYLRWVVDGDPVQRELALEQMRRLNPYIEVLLGLRECIDCPRRSPR